MIICGRESRSKVLMWPHAWREGSFVCFMSPGVPFRVSVADDRRMIGLTSYSRIDFSFIYVLIIDARTDGIRTIKFIINPVDFSAENQLIEDVSDSTPQMSNTSIPTTPKKTSFSYSNPECPHSITSSPFNFLSSII